MRYGRGAAQEEVLTRFFETPGNSVMILMNPEFDCPELNAWLARYGGGAAWSDPFSPAAAAAWNRTVA